MNYKFLDDSINIENIILPNSDKANPILVKNNQNEIKKAIEFIESIGLDNKTLLIGGYPDDPNTYITCKLNKDGTYVYQMYDAAKQKVRMEFEYIIQLVALEVSYIADYDGITDSE